MDKFRFDINVLSPNTSLTTVWVPCQVLRIWVAPLACLVQDSYQSLVWDSSLSSVFKGYIQEHHDRQNNVIFFGTVHKLIISRFSTLL